MDNLCPIGIIEKKLKMNSTRNIQTAMGIMNRHRDVGVLDCNINYDEKRILYRKRLTQC